ncbi:MAG: sensor domain-containing diguanylate cyclase [Butyrivibrio sp.]|uniref:sensor domain-containing diguanylate cyclase n=1 Tax=Butyrivibrio sp. TaxID=28121 RepID=UPI0025D8F1D2|nr:sensor domain-containing diguanylate cyclase [Butyrivibrio sp.]MCR5772854.1 sensor domain-containing diguanylate cyclase [Butyrivibrio sp.]
MNIISDSVLFENLVQLIPAGIFWKDKDRRFLGANQMFLDYYGLKSVEDIIGKNDEEMGWHIDPDPFRNIELKILSTGESVRDVPGECIVKGNLRKIKASKCPIYSNGEIVGLVGYFMDITAEIAERDRLAVLCQTDDLTGLLNRRAFSNIVLEYEKQYKEKNTDFALFMIDIDSFKSINDSYGHEYGNLVLKSTAKNLTMASADNSIAFRYGGDEFIVIHQLYSSSDIESLEKRIYRYIDSPLNIDGNNISIKASIGHAIYSETLSIDTLLELSDNRMYDVKKLHHRV